MSTLREISPFRGKFPLAVFCPPCQTAYAVPVSSLAREIGLPTWLVDVRHEASHKQVVVMSVRVVFPLLLIENIVKLWACVSGLYCNAESRG